MALFELAREHMDREHPEKEIKGEQVRNRIDGLVSLATSRCGSAASPPAGGPG